MNFNDQSKQPRFNDLKKVPVSKQQIEQLRSMAHDINGKKSLIEHGQPHIDSPGKCTLVLFLSSNKILYSSAYLAFANELTRKLHRIDLSMVVNKYIGETENNLSRIFDEADNSDMILLFDEADALFGKRTGGENTYNRNTNKLIDFFLNRLEAFNGIVILAANHRNSLDSALVRRVNQIIDFSNSAELPAAEDDDK